MSVSRAMRRFFALLGITKIGDGATTGTLCRAAGMIIWHVVWIVLLSVVWIVVIDWGLKLCSGQCRLMMSY